MPGNIEIPYLSYEDIRREADAFLRRYHPRGGIPVPIEEIVEFQWKKFVNDFSDDDYGWLEYQAYCFGGLILAPREPLLAHARELVNIVGRTVNLKENRDYAWEVVTQRLAKIFEVSPAVIEKRMTKDKIREQLGLTE